VILCDIGNTNFHFYHNGRIWKESAQTSPDTTRFKGEDLYYISVNDAATERLKSVAPNAINLLSYVRLDTEYQGLGVDRAVACLAIRDGIVIDAGSAITVDIIQNGTHLGGYILPGLAKYTQMYGEISPRLAKSIHFDIHPDLLPQNTADAISYGIIMSLVSLISRSSKHKTIYFTGGDGPFLSRYFPQSIVDNSLIFKGMLTIIKDIEC